MNFFLIKKTFSMKKNFDNSPIVVDLGSYQTKIGYSGDDIPRYFVPSIFGFMKSPENNDFLIGNEAKNKLDSNLLYNPFKDGLIKEKNDSIRLFQHIFEKELEVNSEKKSIILTIPLESEVQKGKELAQILFETFHISYFFIKYSPYYALHTSMKFSGVVLDCGETFTQVVSIFEHCIIPQSILKSKIGGNYININLQKNLKDISYHFNGYLGRELSRKIKEQYLFIKNDENLIINPIEYNINNELSITLNEERYKIPEILFNTLNEEYNLAELIFESIMRCDITIRQLLFNNILICGGTSLLKGFIERLKKELKLILIKEKLNYELNFIILNNRNYTTWIGASIVGSLDLFSQMALSIDEYKEIGEDIIKKKFY